MVEKIKLAIIDNEEAKNATAIDSAEAQLTANKQELKGVSGFFKKIWKHNLAREYYRQKEIQKTKDKIAASGNIYIDEEGSTVDHDEAMSAIIDRFTSDFDEVVDTEAGEKVSNLDESLPEEKELKEEITNLVKEYASGSLSEESFNEQKIRIFAEVATKKKDILDRSGFYADNLLKIAKQIKQNIDHGQKLEDLDLEFEVVVGKAKAGVRTEVNYNKVDKLVEKISSTKLGSLVNETTLATGIGVAYSIASALGTKIASNKALAWGTLGVSTLFTGGIAGIRENKRLQDERRLHNRQMAQGKNFEPDAKRREEMEKFRHKTESAESLTKRVSQIYDKDGNIDKLSYRELIETLDSISEIDTRAQLSSKHRIDLISFSEAMSVEKERANLLIENAKAKVELKKLLDNRSDLVLPGNLSIDDYLKKLSDAKVNLFLKGEEGIEAKNKLFNKMKAKKVALTSIKAAGVGLAIGTLFQETASLFNSDRQGSIERLFDGKSEGKSTTMIEGFRRWLVGGDSPRLGGPFHEQIINQGKINLPAESSLNPQTDGTYTLTRPDDEMFVEHLRIDPEGRFTEESKILLGQHNILFDEHSNTIITGNSTIDQDIIPDQKTSQTVSSEEYVKKHPELFHQVKRNLWFDNDTKVFDKNELKTWWGGEKNAGIDKDGNFIFNVKHMTPGGSYHGNESVDAQGLIKNNNLKMVFSLSRETQNMVCEVPVDQNGNAIISKDSEIGKLLFTTEKGKAKFLGKFAEVVESLGKDDTGAEKIRMLSTVVGDGIKEVTSLETFSPYNDIINPEVKTSFLTNLDIPGDAPIDLPLVFPILPRTPLERATVLKKSNKKTTPEDILIGTGMYGSLYGYDDPLYNKEFYEKRRSKTLIDNPEADLDHFNEIESYFDKFSEQELSEVKELAKQIEPMKKEVKLSVNIPVAGHQEGKNIYKTLENYTKQTSKSDIYEINILVNHPDRDQKGKLIKLDSTISEIKRFKNFYPNINVKVMYKVLPFSQAKIGRARKLLNDAVLYRHHERGRSASDLILVSNDADNEGIAPEYIENFINKFESDKNIDGMLGQLDWDPAAYAKYPAIHIGTRLFQYCHVRNRMESGWVDSSGANFAFKSSIYSAIGGYDADRKAGEDSAIGQAIVFARENNTTMKYAGSRVSRLYTSARRAIDSWKAGFSPTEQWNRGFSAFDNEVRSFQLAEDTNGMINFDDQNEINKLKKSLEYVINRTIDFFERDREPMKKDHPYYQSIINRLGIKYTIDKRNNIVINNMERLIRGLKEYQTMGVPLRDYKSGKINKENFEKNYKKNNNLQNS